ncbi:MAG TPA: hypothetical protein VGE07_18680, partial [Herpetosiphonaceae bacterium]
VASVLLEPRTLLEPLERALGRPVALPEQAVVLGIRALAGLAIGLAQTYGWRVRPGLAAAWAGACGLAGLTSRLGENLGMAAGELLVARLCRPAAPCPDWLRDSGYGAAYWGVTWLGMALVTVGPALLIVRRQRALALADAAAH